MAQTTPVENDYARLSCRVHTRIKQKAEQAASLLGQSITDFTEAALAEYQCQSHPRPEAAL